MVVAFMLLQFSIFLLMMCFSFISWIEFIQSLNLIRTQISLQIDKIIWKSKRFSLLIWLAGWNLFLLWTSPPGRSFLSPARCGSQPSGRWHCLNQALLAHGYCCPCLPPFLVLFTAGQPEPPACAMPPGQPVACYLCPCQPCLIPCLVKTSGWRNKTEV
jgi:hypothetical protein